MGDREHEQSKSSNVNVETPEPEQDHVEAEHDGAAARRASMAGLRRAHQQYTSKGAIPPVAQGGRDAGPTASERAYDKPEIEMPAAYVGHEPGELYMHEGALCERPDAVGACSLEPGYRGRMIAELRANVGTAEARYLAALQMARLDELLKKAPQLGLAAELLIGALGLIGGTLLSGAASLAIKELNRRDVWSGMMKPDEFEGAVLAQTTQMKAVLGEATGTAKGRAKLAFTGATPQSQIKTTFLTTLMNDAGPVLNAVLQNVLDTGDDMALTVASKFFSPSVFTVDACSRHVNSMLERLEQQNIDEIGPDAGISGAASTHIVRLTSFGQHRLAVVKFHNRVRLGTSHGDDWYTKEGEEFVNWIDDDLGDFATGVQESKNGAMKTIDVSFFPERFGPDVKSWIDRTRKGAAR